MASHGASEAKGFQWKLRRQVARLAGYFDKGTTRKYPRTSDAIGNLRSAVDAEMRQRRIVVRKQPRATDDQPPAKKRKVTGATSRKHEMMARRLKKENERLQAKLNDFTVHQGGKHITPAWIVKIFLTSPSQNARGLEKAYRDVIGLDTNSVSRRTMLRIRGAWVVHYKQMVVDVAVARVAAAVAHATINRALFAVVFVRHIQDEADMRMRSGTENVANAPTRSRSTKVQQQVVELITMGSVLEMPTELEALGDKTAATLCSSLERCVRAVVADVFPVAARGAQPQASVRAKPQASVRAMPQASMAAKPQADVWLFHIMIGDGINTNNAAAKQLWACLQEHGLGPRVRYFLAVIVCGTHQTGLAAKGAVTGRAAAAAASGLLYQDIAGVVVRLFNSSS